MITTTVTPEHTGVLFLGRKGEKDARKFVFNMSNWIREMVSAGAPIGEVILLVLRPRERTPYRATVTVSGTDLVWVPQPEDLAKTGEGSIELQMITPGGAILKSAIIHTRAEGCLGDSEGPAPEDQPGWFRQVLDGTREVLAAAEEVARSAELAETSAEQAEDFAKRAEAAAEDAESGVFIAEYGKTPYADVKKAYDEGKTIFFRVAQGTYYKYYAVLAKVYTYGNTQYFVFVRVDGTTIYEYRVYSSGSWSSSTTGLSSANHTHAPEDIGALPALGEGINDPERSIDDLTLTKCYMCGNTVINKGLKGDLPWKASFLLKVEDFTGTGTRAIQTAYKNVSTKPARKWRLWNGTYWSAWVDG